MFTGVVPSKCRVEPVTALVAGHEHAIPGAGDVLPAPGDSKPQGSVPKDDLLSRQQAHPGMAAAAMAAASNVASQFLARPSANQTQAAANNSSEAASSTDTSRNSQTKPLISGEAEIPWRQVAGLLHGQGITDPLGLVSSQPSSACL